MCADGGRKKKLIVAFHFHRSANQAAWRCDECREGGLEKVRNCGYMEPRVRTNARPVWARGGVWSAECPRSYITAESIYLLEEYSVWRITGVSGAATTARGVDAL